MMDKKDLDTCEEMIRHGSLSFHAASRLLPRRVRDPALALYAFCRLADDEVDLKADKTASVLRLRARLDRVYRGQPENAAPDRAFAALVAQSGMPRALPDALLEGFAWDAEQRSFAGLSEVRAYSARVAAAVGVMMCVLMGVRNRHALARACDLGVAMQLTNIARDVGEDAYEGRLYLPTDWLDEAGIDRTAFLANPRASKAIRAMTRRLVMESNRLYFRSEAGISALPVRCRPGIFAARLIYAGISGRLTALDYDGVSQRARTSRMQKAAMLGRAFAMTGTSLIMPQSALLYAPPLDEVRFLVDASCEETARNKSDSFFEALASSEQKARADKAALIKANAPLV